MTYNLENIKSNRVDTVVFNLHEIKQLKFFLGHPVLFSKNCQNLSEKQLIS